MYGCFEYKETIYIQKRNFSGIVEIKYIVPLNKNKDRSLIKFLPIKKKEILEKIKNYNYSLQLLEFSKQLLKKDEKNTIFPYKAKISYKVRFDRFTDLNGILIGTLIYKQKGKTVHVTREFKTNPTPIGKYSTQGEKRVHNQVIKFLKDGYLQFNVFMPKNFECNTTHGKYEEGILSYTLPLSDTMENPEVKSWEFFISMP